MTLLTKLLKPALITFTLVGSAAIAEEMTVYKSQYCGCCTEWVDQMEDAGFTLNVINSEYMNDVKNQYGVPTNLRSCHTAIINGFVVEGHVPAADIKKLLAQNKRMKGIATPGMPQSAPGMDVPGATDTYQVVAFNKAGMQYVYNEYNTK
ncbi:DUF411 domain-containing protein [Moritella sp. 24]|uniref:DUF411 domain-containing protein n=1 Tax=Moritella sp. 24 TaxID=2746230 RepID=UPI001BA9FEEE|nr:DUF411 domain-containing protein [Moritella sp. 24]QUM74951.1 DUF411 domain-containing protein [Moritella sp. 24]